MVWFVQWSESLTIHLIQLLHQVIELTLLLSPLNIVLGEREEHLHNVFALLVDRFTQTFALRDRSSNVLRGQRCITFLYALSGTIEASRMVIQLETHGVGVLARCASIHGNFLATEGFDSRDRGTATKSERGIGF